MDPEEIERLQNFEKEIDQMYDSQTRKLYNYMAIEGAEAFKPGKPLNKFLSSDLFERMISHFESTEEYEKCAYVLDLSVKVKREYIQESLKEFNV
jgi:hypothetical protein